MAHEVGLLDDINVVTAPGASKPAVQRAIASVLPAGVEVVTGQTVANENTSSVNQSLSFFSTALLVFAFISLFVGGFTIFNTFSIIVGQRTRELALLRIVGASRRQVFGSVLAEAAITGLVSSVIGLGLGVLAALGLQALLRGFGITLPPGSLVFEARTVLVGLAVGTGVTVVAAVGPARNAVRIPPVAALDDRQSDGDVSLRRRFAWGTAVALAGALLLAIGLGKPAIQLVGVGAVCIFVGVAMLAPAIARPLSSAIGRPLARLLGEPGTLGRENSMRSHPAAHRPDRFGAHGRPGPGRRDVRESRRLGVQIGHEQRRIGDQRWPHRDAERVGTTRAIRCRPRHRPCRASPRTPPSTGHNSSCGIRWPRSPQCRQSTWPTR